MPAPLLPDDPNIGFNPAWTSGPVVSPSFSVATMRRFCEEIRLDFAWIPGSGQDEFGVTDLELNARFAIPILRNIESPLLITPGFAIHYFDGPEGAAFDLPPRVYDAYLEAAWNPRITTWLSGELAMRVGVYSDFEKVSHDSVRFPSKGLMVLQFTPSFKIKAGVWYLDRNHAKILPAGGIVYQNQDVRWEILFPNPKLAWRLPNYGSVEWWVYVRGEYGGGAWTVLRNSGGGLIDDSIDYNDLRAAVGVEFFRPGGFTGLIESGVSGLFEVGVAFDREVRFAEPTAAVFEPDPNIFIRAGLAY